MSKIVDIGIKEQSSVCEQMRFSVSRASLLNMLSRVSGVVERRNAIDVLDSHCLSKSSKQSNSL